MAAQSAPKVVLKSTTKMSLNERFTNMLKNKQPMPVNIRASMQQQQQLASARNRRLAQQMENRPSVQAALKLKQKSLKQRLVLEAGAVQGQSASRFSAQWCHLSMSSQRTVFSFSVPLRSVHTAMRSKTEQEQQVRYQFSNASETTMWSDSQTEQM
ncbi:hypothetical protein STEG23_023020 [Scotinomys teguina]